MAKPQFKKSDFGIELLEQVRQLQRQNRFIVKAGGSDIGLTESHILTEIDRNSGISAAGLAKTIGIERSTASRALVSLTERKLVKNIAAAEGRNTSYVLTEKGVKIFGPIDRDASTRMAQLWSALSENKQKRLAGYIDQLADGLGAARSAGGVIDHPLRPPIRRLTRGIGLLSDNFMQSGFTSSTWQILEAIGKSEGLGIQHLADELGIARTTTSLLVSKLERKSYVGKESHLNDGRRTILRLSSEGSMLLEEMRKRAAERLELASTGLSREQKVEFLELFRSIGLGKSEREPLTRTNLVIRRIESESDTIEARRFIVTELVQQNLAIHTPAQLLVSAWSAIATKDEVTQAVIEIRVEKQFHRYGIALLLAAGSADRDLLILLLRFAFSEIFAADPTAAIELDKTSPLIDRRIRQHPAFPAQGKVYFRSNDQNLPID